jgi:hypothetical protein
MLRFGHERAPVTRGCLFCSASRPPRADSLRRLTCAIPAQAAREHLLPSERQHALTVIALPSSLPTMQCAINRSTALRSSPSCRPPLAFQDSPLSGLPGRAAWCQGCRTWLRVQCKSSPPSAMAKTPRPTTFQRQCCWSGCIVATPDSLSTLPSAPGHRSSPAGSPAQPRRRAIAAVCS